jgi:hypothetical protein
MRWSVCNLGIFLGVLVARRIAEMRHHVHRRCGHVLSNPFQHRIGAALEVIGHHQVADGKILAPFSNERNVVRHRLAVPRGFGGQRGGPMKPVGLSAVGEQANLLTREEPLTPSVWRKRGFVPTPVWSAHVAA